MPFDEETKGPVPGKGTPKQKGGQPLAEVTYTVRDAREDDLLPLLDIYNDAVITSTATFDLEPQTPEQRRKWFDEHGREYPLIIIEVEGRAVGYATLSPFRDKPAYSRSVESSVYIHRDYRGAGLGTAAMRAAIERAEELNYHTIVAAIVPPNEASVRLHRKLGFKHVGLFAEVGFKFGRWRDVDFFQLHLTRWPSEDRATPSQATNFCDGRRVHPPRNP